MGSRVRIGDIADINCGSYDKNDKWSSIEYIDTGSVNCGHVDNVQIFRIGIDKVPSRARRKVRDGSIIYSAVRPNQRHYAILEHPKDNVLVSTGFVVIDCNTQLVNPRYCYYALTLSHVIEHFQGIAEQSVSTFPTLNASDIADHVIDLPDLRTQNRIVDVLESLDNKLILNRQTNDYLAAMLVALQKQAAETESTSEHRADEMFSIHIGKTPPRKQHEWFSFDHEDSVIWMSIKDMGSSGAYLIDSSEYLTRQAVEKFNIRKCKPGSILLSFKLTIGRVGIVANEMVTNEAIACFASDDERRLAYLYPLLLTYDYASMGSTSSIATAVNSKMVKAMPIQIPSEDVLDSYYEQAKPIFELLLSNTREIASLEQIRNALLPKLMSGEIDVSQIELDVARTPR